MTDPTFTQLTSTLWVLQSELYATNHGVFIDQGEACLIDPGLTDAYLDAIASFVDAQQATVSTIVLTHGHWDHLLGVSRFPNAQVIAQARYLDVLREHSDDIQEQVAKWVSQSDEVRTTPFVPPRPTSTFDETLTHSVGGATLRLLHTPGHAPDHLSLYAADTKMLWAGDLLSNIEIPLVSQSLKAYQRTLAKIAALDIQALVPGHGAATVDAAEIQQRLAEDRAYLTELRSRVVRALATGKSMAKTVAACEEMAYRQPESNATAHCWNVESVYVELGGHVDGVVGWHQEA